MTQTNHSPGVPSNLATVVASSATPILAGPPKYEGTGIVGTGVISTVMGTGARGDAPNPDPLKFSLSRPHGVLFSGGVVYISDSEAHRILALR